MNNWEIFTWITVFILGFGSVAVFIFFVKDIKEILKKSGHNVSQVIHEAGHKLPVTYFDQIRIFLDQ